MPSTALLALILLAPPPAATGAECALRPTHGTPLLLGDVSKQTLHLTSTGKCDKIVAGAVLVNSADNRHRALVEINPIKPIKGAATTWTLAINAAIKAPTSQLSGTWNLFPSEQAMLSGQKASAQLYINSAPVSVATTTRVRYADPILDDLWSSQVNTDHTAYTKSSDRLTNEAALTLPAMGEVSTWNLCLSPNACSPVTSIKTIEFTPESPSSAPITATADATRPHGDEKFTLNITLAAAAQPSSLPLNVAEVAYVLCQKDVRLTTWDAIHHNKLAAVSDPTARNNQCKLIISEEEILASIAKSHDIPYSRGTCTEKSNAQNNTEQSAFRDELVNAEEDIEDRCEKVGAKRGEVVTVIDTLRVEDMKALRALYGRQRATLYVYTTEAARDASKKTFYFDATQVGNREIPIDFGAAEPSPSAPYTIELTSQATADNSDPSASAAPHPARTYRSKLRPKGPFGITHFGRSLGSKSLRLFATVPLSLTAVRFPAAGLDLTSSKESSIAQLSTLTTGLLITGEPWDYTRGANMFSIPFRLQAGLLFSNWVAGRFHPSTFLGGAITLPLWHGANQLDTDLALGIGWEVDLRRGYESFGPRNHLLVTLGFNIFSLFGPQSAPK
jgi:hypothetical protein